MNDTTIYKPRSWKQELFVSAAEDIVLYGGQAGGGKTAGLLLCPLQYLLRVKGYSGVIFRRNTTQIRNPGGLWDEAHSYYSGSSGYSVEKFLEWRWLRYNSKLKFSHLEHEWSVHDWQGAQIPFIGFDELTHFSKNQFLYMLSRNRSVIGVPPIVRMTCNPDADSWVASMIEWYIDQSTGYAIPERSGITRYFIIREEEFIWANRRQILIDRYGPETRPKSFTFIHATLADNPILMAADPDYAANLDAQSNVTRERLKHGNWKIRHTAGKVFPRENATFIDRAPENVIKWIRRWDLAGTEEFDPIRGKKNRGADWTAGGLFGLASTGEIIVADMIRVQEESDAIRNLVANTAAVDPPGTEVKIARDAGQAGKDQAKSYENEVLAGFPVSMEQETGSKLTRADTAASWWQRGKIIMVRGGWNEEYINELAAFPTRGHHDDQVDVTSSAVIDLKVKFFSLLALT